MAKSGGGVQIEKYCKDTQLIDFKRLTYTHADDSRTLVINYDYISIFLEGSQPGFPCLGLARPQYTPALL